MQALKTQTQAQAETRLRPAGARRRGSARASSTDADASVMKMGDGGFRPAYNVQFATDCAAQVIVGVDAVTAGSDMAQLAPMWRFPFMLSLLNFQLAPLVSGSCEVSKPQSQC